MLPLGLFCSRTVSVAVATGFAFMVGYYGLPFVMSLYLQQLRGLSALGTGVAFLPMMLTGAVLTPFTAWLAERFGARVLVTAGLLAITAGLAVIALMPASVPVLACRGRLVAREVDSGVVVPLVPGPALPAGPVFRPPDVLRVSAYVAGPRRREEPVGDSWPPGGVRRGTLT